VQFIETIYKILKPGGVWINLGPLLYHFSDLPNEESIEPSYDAIRDVILGFGFQLEVTVFAFDVCIIFLKCSQAHVPFRKRRYR
jgi:hypothetical protein